MIHNLLPFEFKVFEELATEQILSVKKINHLLNRHPSWIFVSINFCLCGFRYSFSCDFSLLWCCLSVLFVVFLSCFCTGTRVSNTLLVNLSLNILHTWPNHLSFSFTITSVMGSICRFWLYDFYFVSLALFSFFFFRNLNFIALMWVLFFC